MTDLEPRPNPLRRLLKSPTAVLVAIAAVGIPAVLLFRPEAVKEPKTKPSPTATTSSSSSPKPFETPVAVVVYPIGKERSLTLLDRNGTTKPCLQGTGRLTVNEVLNGVITFRDREAVFDLPLDCSSKPRRITDVKTLLGRPNRVADDHLSVGVSPDGSRLSVSITLCPPTEFDCNSRYFFVGNRDGSGWRKVAAAYGWEWIDDRHVRGFDGGDPFAIDVNSGALNMLRDPEVYEGALSPDGRHSIFRLTGGEGVALAEYDLATRARRAIGLSGTLLPVHCCGIWSPLGRRFLTRRDSDDTLTLYSAEGRKEMTAKAGLSAVTVGWLTENALWALQQGGTISVIDLRYGVAGPLVALPDYQADPGGNNGGPIYPNITARPSHDSASLVAVSDLAIHDEPTLGLSFRLPLRWKVDPCKCPEPYPGTRELIRPRVPNTDDDFGYELKFSTTADSAAKVIDTLKNYFHADAAHAKRTDIQRVTLTQTSVTIGGFRFQRLDFAYEYNAWYFVGRVGSRTIIMQAGYNVDDPYVQTVLGSMRFR